MMCHMAWGYYRAMSFLCTCLQLTLKYISRNFWIPLLANNWLIDTKDHILNNRLTCMATQKKDFWSNQDQRKILSKVYYAFYFRFVAGWTFIKLLSQISNKTKSALMNIKSHLTLFWHALEKDVIHWSFIYLCRSLYVVTILCITWN